MSLARELESLLAEKAESAGVFNAGIAGIAEGVIRVARAIRGHGPSEGRSNKRDEINEARILSLHQQRTLR
jgi:hypothetical protein